MREYDLVVVGGGPAGTPVIVEFAKLFPEKKIAMIDKKGELGGECLFDGCIPSKIMQMSAKLIRELDTLKSFGIELSDTHYRLVWEKIVQRKERILAHRADAAIKNIEQLQNVEILKAEASFIDEHKLLVRYENDKTEQINFEKCVVATGSNAFIPKYEGSGAEKVWTNEDFFDTMELPESMSIIGDGAIAIEFAQILATLGVTINLLSKHAGILKHVERDFSNIVLKEIEQHPNINLYLKADVKTINYENDFEIIFMQDSEEKRCHSQRVLVATGRVANIEGLKLENAGVAFSKKGIQVDKHLVTTAKNIYANGDVADGFPKFAHTAMYGAHTIAQNLFVGHNLFSVDYSKNSWVLFSSPNIASAGISELEAQKAGLDVVIGVYDYAIDAKFQIENDNLGYLKFIVEKSSKKIIGISILLDEANAIIGEGATIVANGLTLSDLVATIHPHPTFSESFGFLAKQMMGEIMVEKLKNPVVNTLLEIERFL
ncbi:MAG TPA: NAD(P)/FAD-dependent oxidoreductase [Helicobacteraceae bacterium]|nr:NAD(P)/FAD-dependent oxidoreductase [Helicobacteraceae bacterium]